MIAFVAFAAGGCAGRSFLGYSTGGLYPSNLRTVAIPIVKSESFRRDLEFQLTEQIIKELEQSGFKVVASERADTELLVTIVNYDKTGYGLDGYNNPRGGMMALTQRVRWVDKRSGATLREGDFKIEAAPAALASTETFVIDVAQSKATADQRMVEQTARSVVALMQTPW